MNHTVAVLPDFDATILKSIFHQFDADILYSFYDDDIEEDVIKQQAIVDFVKALEWIRVAGTGDVDIVMPDPPLVELSRRGSADVPSYYSISEIMIYGMHFILNDVPYTLWSSATVLYITHVHPVILSKMLNDGMDVELIIATCQEGK